MGPRKQAAADLLRSVGNKPENVMEIGRLAASLIDSEDRKASGLLFAGTVRKIDRDGDAPTAVIKLGGVEKHVTLATARALGLAEGDRVLVLGSLALAAGDSPIEHQADEPLVWLGLCEKFEPQAPPPEQPKRGKKRPKDASDSPETPATPEPDVAATGLTIRSRFTLATDCSSRDAPHGAGTGCSQAAGDLSCWC